MAHEGLWQQLMELARQETADRAMCQYLDDPERFVITMLNTEYSVNLAAREIFPVGAGSGSAPAEFLEQPFILAYLINAKDLPLAQKHVKGETLPGGQFFFRGVHCLPTKEVEEAFGECPEKLCEAGEQLGGRRCQFGDASIELNILPRLPVTIIVWAGDDEFDARASILFDQTAGEHLALDALLAAVNLAVRGIIQTCKQEE